METNKNCPVCKTAMVMHHVTTCFRCLDPSKDAPKIYNAYRTIYAIQYQMKKGSTKWCDWALNYLIRKNDSVKGNDSGFIYCLDYAEELVETPEEIDRIQDLDDCIRKILKLKPKETSVYFYVSW